MKFLRTLICNFYFYFLSILLIFTFGLWTFIQPSSAVYCGYIWCKISLWGVRWIVGIRPVFRGVENIPDGPCLMVSKHQSALDPLLMYSRNFRAAFVVKKELVDIPIMGHCFKNSDMMAVDTRKSVKKPSVRQQIIDKCRDIFPQGRKVIIYAQGCRTPCVNDSDYKYRTGAYSIYQAFPDIPIIPVALNTGLFWGFPQFIKNQGEAIVEYLPRFVPEEGMDCDAFIKKLSDVIDGATRSLEKEAMNNFNISLPSVRKSLK